MIPDNTPILVASAQVVLRDVATKEEVRSPGQLVAEAVSTALATAGNLATAVDTLVHTRALTDSLQLLKAPFGCSSKPPLSVAKQVGISPSRLIYGDMGGHTPQRLLNEFAESIYRGDSQCVVICGGESTGAERQALKSGWQLDWHDDPAGEIEDRGLEEVWNEVEVRHHIDNAHPGFALLENAWRYKHGLNVQEHRHLVGSLLARFSEIAAANPHAQFPIKRSADFLAASSNENYTINEPYNKWMIAQDAVNQAAAIVLISVGKARELGIPESQWVFLHGYGDADDTYISGRSDLSSSIAIKAAVDTALAMSGKQIDDIALLDLYSCFPIAVLAASDALGIAWDSRDLTVTGGLPFFGGPGNSYSLHAIAEMYQRLSADPGVFGLVSANGGFLSKQSVGIYSTTPCEDWSPGVPGAAQGIVDSHPKANFNYPYNGEAIIESYCVVYKRGTPAIGLCLGREPAAGNRVIAKVASDDQTALREMLAEEPIGRKIVVETRERGAYFTFA